MLGNRRSSLSDDDDDEKVAADGGGTTFRALRVRGPFFRGLSGCVDTKSNCNFWKNIHQIGSLFENGTPNAVGKMKRILEGDVKRDAWSKILRRGESQVKKVAMVTSL
jgi:hypothetical protein